ncbi:MAG: hypothetical protein QNK33_00740, partial [Bacteroidales bacterium]|nr:hypothetical protein [Bacteroidales bacterium]
MTKTKYFCIIFFVNIFILGSLSAQQINETDSTNNIIKAITASQVTAEISNTNALLFKKQAQLLSSERRAKLNTEIDTLSFKLSLLREDPRIHNIQSLNFRSLGHLKSDWVNLRLSLQESQNELSIKVDRIENSRLELVQLVNLWKLTQLEAQKTESPESVLEQIRVTKSSVQDMLDLMRTDSQYMQDKLVVLSNNSIICSIILEEIASSRDNVTSRVFEINQEPL